MPAANDYIREKLDDIAKNQERLTAAFSEFQQTYFERHQTVVGTATRAHERIDRIEIDLQKLTADVRSLEKIAPWVKGIAFIVTGMAIPIILAAAGFVWAVITHQVKLLP